jgi:hypothetical protein
MQLMKSSLEHNETGYTVGTPWKGDVNLPNNFETAKRRLQSLLYTFRKKTQLEKPYRDVILDYESSGYIHRVPVDEVGKCWYLPDFAVVRPDRDTTKVRVVFDGASQHRGVSLNDAILDCPKLQNDLFDILVRFRRFPIALACDISQMYLQIKIPEVDRKYFRFLWSEAGQEPVGYEFDRVCFGQSAAPAQAIFVSQENAKKYRSEYPRAVESVLESTFMDDCLDSAETVEEAISLKSALSTLWGHAGMTPHKWMSNSKQVLPSAESDKKDITGEETPLKKVSV